MGSEAIDVTVAVVVGRNKRKESKACLGGHLVVNNAGGIPKMIPPPCLASCLVLEYGIEPS